MKWYSNNNLEYILDFESLTDLRMFIYQATKILLEKTKTTWIVEMI